VLDGSKTGLTVIPEVFQRDRRVWQSRIPYWKRTTEDRDGMSAADIDMMCRRGGRRPYVMDIISRAAVEIGRRKLQAVERQFAKASKSVADTHLMQPWRNATKVARRYEEDEQNLRRERDLKKIQDTVKQARRHFFDGQGVRQSGAHGRGLANIRNRFAANPPPEQLLMDSCDIDRLKASYAYMYDWAGDRTGRSPFAWEMAMSMLCTLKGMLCAFQTSNRH
jgi:RNA-dependent RNA polymerase